MHNDSFSFIVGEAHVWLWSPIDRCNDSVHRDGPWDYSLFHAKAERGSSHAGDIARSHEWYNWKSIFALGFSPTVSSPQTSPSIHFSLFLLVLNLSFVCETIMRRACIGKAVYKFAVIAIELAEHSFCRCNAIAIFISFVIPRVNSEALRPSRVYSSLFYVTSPTHRAVNIVLRFGSN